MVILKYEMYSRCNTMFASSYKFEIYEKFCVLTEILTEYIYMHKIKKRTKNQIIHINIDFRFFQLFLISLT